MSSTAPTAQLRLQVLAAHLAAAAEAGASTGLGARHCRAADNAAVPEASKICSAEEAVALIPDGVWLTVGSGGANAERALPLAELVAAASCRMLMLHDYRQPTARGACRVGWLCSEPEPWTARAVCCPASCLEVERSCETISLCIPVGFAPHLLLSRPCITTDRRLCGHLPARAAAACSQVGSGSGAAAGAARARSSCISRVPAGLPTCCSAGPPRRAGPPCLVLPRRHPHSTAPACCELYFPRRVCAGSDLTPPAPPPTWASSMRPLWATARGEVRPRRSPPARARAGSCATAFHALCPGVGCCLQG